jgi:hypothetical protein
MDKVINIRLKMAEIVFNIYLLIPEYDKENQKRFSDYFKIMSLDKNKEIQRTVEKIRNNINN